MNRNQKGMKLYHVIVILICSMHEIIFLPNYANVRHCIMYKYHESMYISFPFCMYKINMSIVVFMTTWTFINSIK